MDRFLEVMLEGEAVRWGRIPVSYLSAFLSGLQKVLYRTGFLLLGRKDNAEKTFTPQHLRQLIDIDLVEITHGSPSTVLSFARTTASRSVWDDEEVMHIFETALVNLNEFQAFSDVVNPVFDRELLLAWSTIGNLFLRGVSRITFTLYRNGYPLRVSYTSREFDLIRQHALTTVEGYMFLTDLRRRRISLQPHSGKAVSCVFTEEQEPDVRSMIGSFVRVMGKAVINPATGTLRYLRTHTIEPLERDPESIAYDFWTPRIIDELARQQRVQPVDNIASLYGTWPGKTDDGFEQFVEGLRKWGNAEGNK
ncbi:hypothetical protein [Chloroflexus sp.]|uniref:hypothetical protein n=1 Tax=Chloroflexus sp. TaxID=1904827 RepID=UPI002ADDD6BB|nr:hypothetical protein [Chloroflexus sp.]